MSALPYWWITRPHRKLIRVPKTLAAFAGVAVERTWTGNTELQIDFENRLEQLDLKRSGDHTERARGKGGSGGRTHAALLYSLGLFFYHHETAEANEEVHLTLAGQALVDQEDALPILRKQVLAYQFPSAFSVSPRVNVDRKFRLRPFVMPLKLLRHARLSGYLTDREIAARVSSATPSRTPIARRIELLRAFSPTGPVGRPRWIQTSSRKCNRRGFGNQKPPNN